MTTRSGSQQRLVRRGHALKYADEPLEENRKLRRSNQLEVRTFEGKEAATDKKHYVSLVKEFQDGLS